MSPNLACVTALGLALLLAGCTTTRLARPSTTGSTAVKPEGTALKPEGTALKPGAAINDTCPISGRPVDPKVPGVEFEGRTIGFCSPVCAAQWHETPIAIKLHFLAMSEWKRTSQGLPQSAAPAAKPGSTR